MTVDVVIYQVGKRYAWTLQERKPGLDRAQIIKEGTRETFRWASEEAGQALREYQLQQGSAGNESITVQRGISGGWHWSCTCGSFGWSWKDVADCPSCRTTWEG